MTHKDKLVDPPHWTIEYKGMEEYCEEVGGQKPLIVRTDEAEDKYKDKRLLSKVVEYIERRTSEQEDAIADLMVEVERMRIKIKKLALSVKVLLKTLPEDRVWKGPKKVEAMPRVEWGAHGPKKFEKKDRLTPPIKKVHVTFGTKTERCAHTLDCKRIVQGIQTQDIFRGLKDIAYNFLVGEDGVVYEGRGWTIKPELANTNPDYQDSTVDIAFIGSYDEETYPYVLSDYLQDFLQFAMFKNILPDDVKVIMK